MSEIIRLIDGPLAPFGDAEQLRTLIDRDDARRALYKVFLEVRDAAAKILEGTVLADLIPSQDSASEKAKIAKRKKAERNVLPMAIPVGGSPGHD